MLFSAALIILYTIVFRGSPFDNIQLLKASTNHIPSWLVVTNIDKFGSSALQIIGFFGKKALVVLQMANVVGYVLAHFGSFSVDLPSWICAAPGIPCSININFGDAFGSLITKLTSLMEEGFDYAARFAISEFESVNLPIGGIDLSTLVAQLDSIMAALPNLDFTVTFDIFNIDGQLPSFRLPSWLPIVFFAFAIVAVVTVVGALLFEGLKPLKQMCMSLILSGTFGFVVLLVRLKMVLDNLSYNVSISFNQTAYWYLAGITLAISGVVMIFMGSEVSSDQKQSPTGAMYSSMPLHSSSSSSPYLSPNSSIPLSVIHRYKQQPQPQPQQQQQQQKQKQQQQDQKTQFFHFTINTKKNNPNTDDDDENDDDDREETE